MTRKSFNRLYADNDRDRERTLAHYHPRSGPQPKPRAVKIRPAHRFNAMRGRLYAPNGTRECARRVKQAVARMWLEI